MFFVLFFHLRQCNHSSELSLTMAKVLPLPPPSLFSSSISLLFLLLLSSAHSFSIGHRLYAMSTATDDHSGSPAPSESFRITWERQAAASIRAAKEASPQRPFMVALVGIPGSGKTTSASILQDLLSNDSHNNHNKNNASDATTTTKPSSTTMVMPFDGYHIPMARLQEFPDSADAVYRRGAPDTFDADALRRDLQRIRHGDEPTVSLPGFDHAKGDPERDAHTFCRAQHDVVICEGLYLLHPEWGLQGETIKAKEGLEKEEGNDNDNDGFFDYSIFIESDLEACVERLKIRNRVIPGYTPKEIDVRVEKVDRVNAMTVLRSKDRAECVVQSATESESV